jgi:hypothetical protein
MIKGCGMRLLVMGIVVLSQIGPAQSNMDINPSRIRHEVLKSYCQMVKREPFYQREDLENACVMKVSVFNNKVSLSID